MQLKHANGDKTLDINASQALNYQVLLTGKAELNYSNLHTYMG